MSARLLQLLDLLLVLTWQLGAHFVDGPTLSVLGTVSQETRIVLCVFLIALVLIGQVFAIVVLVA